MDALVEWGYLVIQTFQTYRHPFFDFLFKVFDVIGNEEFTVVFIIILYWMVDKRLGTRFAALVIFSTYLNALAKAIIVQPRPSSTQVAVLVEAEGGGLPSGHTQTAVVSWGFLARAYSLSWFRWLMGFLIVAMGLSRVYLGVHFPHDVLLAWLLGALLLWLYITFGTRIERWLAAQPLTQQIAIPAGVVLLLILLFHSEDALKSMSSLFGLTISVPLERIWVRFKERGGGWLKGIVRFVLGLLVAVVIWQGLKPFLAPLGLVGGFVRYSLLGIWVGVGAPWMFVKSGLTEQEDVVVG